MCTSPLTPISLSLALRTIDPVLGLAARAAAEGLLCAAPFCFVNKCQLMFNQVEYVIYKVNMCIYIYSSERAVIHEPSARDALLFTTREVVVV